MVNYPKGVKQKSSKLSLEKNLTKKSNSLTKKSVGSTKPADKNQVTFGKRGMDFEADINATNEYYLAHNIAVVHKKPTPVQIVRVEYPKRSKAKITEAYFRQASTTDYSGVYQGHYIDFEAKETHQKTSFPLKNFHRHQIEHMKKVLQQDGLAFVLLCFSELSETYYLKASYLIDYYEAHEGQKSMSYKYIQEHGILIPNQQIPRIPYIDIIKKQIGGESHSY